MATAPPISSAFVFIFLAMIFAQSQSSEFIFNGFNDSEINLTREGASIIKPSGALRLTNRSLHAIGHAFYDDPIQMFENNSSSASSFSTHFVFAIVPPAHRGGGYGLAFTISPAKKFPGAQAAQYLGIFNSSNDNSTSNHVFAVEFDTVRGFMENSESETNNVGININSLESRESRAASYYVDPSKGEAINLESGDSIQAWIEYDGTSKLVTVTIAPISISTKPVPPLMSYKVDLKDIFKESMYVGFSASTGEKASSHYILGWSFGMNGGAPPLNLSQLPNPPPEEGGSSIRPRVKAFIGTLAGVVFLLGVV